MRDEREVEVLEFYEQGANTPRAHLLVIEVCERNVSPKYQRESESLPWRKGVTSSVPLRRCVCRLELRRSSREIDESKSDVTNTVGEPQIQCIERVDTGCAWKMVFSILTRGLCVFLNHVTSQP